MSDYTIRHSPPSYTAQNRHERKVKILSNCFLRRYVDGRAAKRQRDWSGLIQADSTAQKLDIAIYRQITNLRNRPLARWNRLKWVSSSLGKVSELVLARILRQSSPGKKHSHPVPTAYGNDYDFNPVVEARRTSGEDPRTDSEVDRDIGFDLASRRRDIASACVWSRLTDLR